MLWGGRIKEEELSKTGELIKTKKITTGKKGRNLLAKKKNLPPPIEGP